VAAARTELPTWAVLEFASGDELTSAGTAVALVSTLAEAGASAILFEVATVDLGLAYLKRFRPAFELHGIAPGVLLAASEASVRGFHDETSNPERWVARAVDLSAGGARAIGGGAGTTEAHTHRLAVALGSLHPSSRPVQQKQG
jgi:5-methyltetrahydrofolate--homocysteine methyltransferase